MSDHGSLARLADLIATLRPGLTSLAGSTDALSELARLAVQQVEGAEQAGITVLRGERLRSEGQTDPLVTGVDRIQYQLRSGPCVDAVLTSGPYSSGDLAQESQWPQFGRRASEEWGVRSMLSFRLFLEDELDTRAALNLYSTQGQAFDDESITVGLVLAASASFAVLTTVARQRSDNLQVALASSREIGIAIGVLMSQLKVTRDQGFELLSVVSQASQRKVSDIAREVAETGMLPELPHRPSARA